MMAQVPKQKPEAVPNCAVRAEKLGLSTVPAAWPSGVSLLAQAYDDYRRREVDQVRAGRLMHS